MNSALGGVLFIDEAYSLYRGKDDSFGLEAIDTLVKGMEDHRGELVGILAGYTKEMQAFLSANSGLQSRFPNIVEFPDYTGAELLQILKLQAKSRGYVLDARCDAPLLAYFNAVQLAVPGRRATAALRATSWKRPFWPRRVARRQTKRQTFRCCLRKISNSLI